MKIFGYNIDRSNDLERKIQSEVNNALKKAPKRAHIVEKIVRTQLIRTRQDIQKWRNAVADAESDLRPDREALIEMYRDLVIDGHFSGIQATREKMLQSCKIILVNQNGEPVEELEKRIRTKWFKKLQKIFIQTYSYGHSLVAATEWDTDLKTYKDIELVRREHVIPDITRVKEHASIYSEESMIDYTDPIINKYHLEIGERDNLGLLMIAAPYIIWKRGVMVAWAQFGEIFGMPIRIGRTDIEDPVKRVNMENFLQEMGQASWAVMAEDDEIELKEGVKSDAHEVFERMVVLCNSEMSKAMLGQTMTSDDGSSYSQANVHKEILDLFGESDKWDFLYFMRDELLPKMQMAGLMPTGIEPMYDQRVELDPKQRAEVILGLINSGKYKVSADNIQEYLGIEVEEIETTETQENGGFDAFQNVVNYYQDLKKGRV